MNTIRTSTRLIAGALLCLVAQLASADWKLYSDAKYGFAMLIPEGTKMTEKELGGGWGQLWGTSEGVKFYGIAKLGTKESNAEIEKYAVKTIGIPASEWKLVDAGGGNGFERSKTFEAVRGSKLFFGGYGVGPKGNYLLYLETTVEDYNAHKADYLKWYKSIKVN
jgi:hypothetical protein